MASPWRDTTALPAGADGAAFEACPVVPSNGRRGPDPDDLATDAALEDALGLRDPWPHYDEGARVVGRTPAHRRKPRPVR